MTKMKKYLIFRLVVFTALAIVIGVMAHQIMPYINYLVGGAMIVYGVEGLIFSVDRERAHFYKDYQFFLGTIELLLGIIMMTLIKDAPTTCVIWGTWTIVRESYELYETSHKIMHHFPAVLSLILSIIEIVFSVLLIVSASGEYEHHALTHVYLLIPELIINGISPFLYDLFNSYKAKKKQKKNKSE